MDFNSDCSYSQFNGTLNELPFDILSVIFTFVFLQNTQTYRNPERATRSQLSCVSKNIFSVVCSLTNVETDLLANIYRVSVELMYTHKPYKLKEIFIKNKHLLPFSHFDVSSFEEFIEVICLALLVFDEEVIKTYDFFQTYLNFLAKNHSITFVLAESVFAGMKLSSCKTETVLEIMTVLFREGKSHNLVLEYNNYEKNFVNYIEDIIGIPEIITKEQYDLCMKMFKEFFFAWKEELTSIYVRWMDENFINMELEDDFYQNLNSMTMDTVVGFELVNIFPEFIPSDFPEFIPSDFPVTGFIDCYMVQILVPCFQDSDCTEKIFEFPRFNFNKKFYTISEYEYSDSEYEDFGQNDDDEDYDDDDEVDPIFG
jgi:hypothetical protein